MKDSAKSLIYMDCPNFLTFYYDTFSPEVLVTVDSGGTISIACYADGCKRRPV